MELARTFFTLSPLGSSGEFGFTKKKKRAGSLCLHFTVFKEKRQGKGEKKTEKER